jgi:hypothetical protein
MGEEFAADAGRGAGVVGALEATVKTGGELLWARGLIRRARMGGSGGAGLFLDASRTSVAVISTVGGGAGA